MKYYPVFLDVKARPCLVVGGGPVGARKAETLDKCGADVRVISRKFCRAFDDLKHTRIRLKEKPYETSDVTGMFLVFAATDNSALNKRIKSDTAKSHILCNVADSSEPGDFILPSAMNRGDLIIAVSTCGTSPAVAKKIRQELARQFGPEYTGLLELMGAVRKKLLAAGHAPDVHRKSFHALIEKGMLEHVEAGNVNQINTILADVLGKAYRYEDLVPKE